MKLHAYMQCMGLFAIAALGGCSPTKRIHGISVSPKQAEVVVDASNQGRMKMVFHVPTDELSKRGRLLITPRLVTDGSEVVERYAPVAVDAPLYTRKMHRKEVLEGYVDSIPGQVVRADRWSAFVEVPYEAGITLPEGLENGYIDALVSVEGCASCGTIDSLFVARLRKMEPAPVDTFSLRWIRPVIMMRPKLVEGQGVAALQFEINRAEIDGSLGNNRAELEKMEQALRPILQDSLVTLREIRIIGTASADGPFTFNMNLAYRRAVAAKQWLAERIKGRPGVADRIYADVRPEGWEPVLESMRQAGDPEADAVEAVLKRLPTSAGESDDLQERAIRQLPCWERIRTNYLQKDRKVEYHYAYTQKSFTSDEELLKMYVARPDAFSEEEFFRVAELMPSLPEKIEAYRKLLAYYPDSEIGKNNLAVLEHEWLSAGGRKGERR